MYEVTKKLARHLRKNATPTEDIVWQALRNRQFMGLKFRRQHIIRGFIVDFYCSRLKLAIEIDGKIHLQQKDYDKKRQWLIELEGLSFIRVTNEEIQKDMNILLNKINTIALSLPSNNFIFRGRAPLCGG
jgi:type I restriction enzyme R subunit